MTIPGTPSRMALMGGRLFALALLCWAWPSTGQSESSKQINVQTQFWISLNGTARLSDHWGMLGDIHLRRNDFIQDPSFFLLRGAAHYWVTEALTLSVGYGHNWIAPARDDWQTWTGENRIYQQLQYAAKFGKVSLLERIRNEQRWHQEVVDDVLTGEHKFTNRVRLLVSVTAPVSRKPSFPSLVLSDEILVQFGPEVVTNTFDQNRLFTGLKQRLAKTWGVDFGYMLVFQQKASGNEYDLNHTLRLFFYFTPDFRSSKSEHEPAGGDE